MGYPFIRLSVVLWKNDFHLIGYISGKWESGKKWVLKKSERKCALNSKKKMITGKKWVKWNDH